MKLDISAAGLDRAREMRAQCMSWDRIADCLGVSRDTIHRRLDPAFAKRKREGTYTLRQRRALAGGEPVDDRPTAREIAALRRLIPPDTRDLTARTFGDPLFQRSALFQKLSGGASC